MTETTERDAVRTFSEAIMRRASVLLCTLASLSACAQSSSDTDYFRGDLIFSPEIEAIYMERYEKAQTRVSGDEIYIDQEEIPGATQWSSLPIAGSGERTISDSALDAAEAYAASNNSSAFIVWRKGKIEREVYFDSFARTEPVLSYSLSKPVAAFAIGRALELGLIESLDQPVADFVTEWKSDVRREKILIRHLLDMRAGFLPQLPAQGPDDVISRTFLHPHHDEIIIADYPVIDEPGTRYEYNNAASEMVPVVIERASGRRYAEFLGTELFQKIGAQGGTIWVNRPGGMAHGGCCMMAPPELYVRLATLMLQDGVWDDQRLLPIGYVDEMITPTEQNPYFGLSVWVAGSYTERRGFAHPDRDTRKVFHSEPYLASDLYLFDGNGNQVVYIVPSQDLVILRTGLPSVRVVDGEWDNTYLPNVIMRGIEKHPGTSQPQRRL